MQEENLVKESRWLLQVNENKPLNEKQKNGRNTSRHNSF